MGLFDGYTLGDGLSLPSFEDAGIEPSPSINTGYQPSIFGQVTDFGKDLLTSYLDLQGQKVLLEEQGKIARSGLQQQSLLGAVEQPQNTNAYTFSPEELAALAGTTSGGNGGSNKTFVYLAVAAALYVAIK